MAFIVPVICLQKIGSSEILAGSVSGHIQLKGRIRRQPIIYLFTYLSKQVLIEIDRLKLVADEHRWE